MRTMEGIFLSKSALSDTTAPHAGYELLKKRRALRQGQFGENDVEGIAADEPPACPKMTWVRPVPDIPPPRAMR